MSSAEFEGGEVGPEVAIDLADDVALRQRMISVNAVGAPLGISDGNLSIGTTLRPRPAGNTLELDDRQLDGFAG